MFEQGFSYLLSRFLGEFVQDGNFSKDNVQVGIWSGYVVLENLVLKRKIVDSLELPVNLVHGMIGRLELKIPWANLGSEPVVVILDRVHIVVEPKYEWDPAARKRRERNIKQAKLAGAELFATRRLVEGESETYTNLAQKWLLERLLSQLVDNLQVTIRDVHIRFEDHISCSKPFSAGVTFECLHAFSKEEEARQPQPQQKGSDGRPSPARSGTYKKLIRVEQLAMYWNPVLATSIQPYYTQFIGRNPAEIELMMARTVSRRVMSHTEGPRHHYILHPIDFDIHLVVDRDPVTSQPQPHVTVTIDDLKMSIEDRQFREYLILMSNFDSFQQIEKHSSLRPTVPVLEDPIAWWQYAVNVVLEQNRAKRSAWSWVTLHQRSKDRLVYIELWKRKLVGHHRDGRGEESTFEELHQLSRERRAGGARRKYPALSPATISILESLEDKLTFEDIILFRSMAEKDLSEGQQSQKSWLGGWASFLMGGWYGGVSEEEKHKLFEALRFDPDTIFRAGQRAADPYAVASKVLLRINKGSVVLGLSTPSTVESYNMAAMPFLQHNLHSLEVDVTVMGDGSHVKVKVQLQDFDCAEIMQNHNAGPGANQYEYSQIASRRITDSARTGSEAVTPKKVHRPAGAASAPLPPLLTINIETQPPAEPYDTVVRAKLDEMKVIFAPSAKWLAAITTFVTWPEEIDYWMDLQMSAMSKLSDLNSQIEAKLEYMMQSHSAVSLDVDLKAPILVISPHATITPDCDLLIVDLGRVTMTTEQLATLEYLGQRGEIASDTASTRHDDSFLLGPQMHHRGYSLHQSSLADFMRQSSADSRSIDDKRSERSTSVRGSRRLAPRPGSIRRPLSSNWNRAETNTVITNVEPDIRDQLFDKYQMHIHHMGVYLVKAVNNWLSLDFDNSPSTVCASIVSRFDLTADLLVSALPWDSTLPPVKIVAEMPELNIRLSEHKLLWLARILPKLVQSGMTALEASGEHLRKLENAQRKYKTADVTLTQEFDEVLQHMLEVDEEKHSQETKDVDAYSRDDDADFYDADDNGMFDEQSLNLRADLRRRMSHGTASESFRSFRSHRARSIASEDSFDSAIDFDEVLETTHTAEELKESIRTHEANRIRLLGELRVIETQGNSSLAQEKHRQLQELDRELSQLKANYMDILMQLQAEAHDLESHHDFQFDQPSGLVELLEGVHRPAEDTLEELALKRNQFIASMLKPRLKLDNMKKTRKELVHLRVIVQVLQVQLMQDESTTHASSKPYRRESVVEPTALINFRVSGVSLRLRHSTAHSQVSFLIRDMDIEDAFHSRLSQKPCYVATSEPVYSGLSPEYKSFLREEDPSLVLVTIKVKYGQTYQRGLDMVSTADRYAVRATLNYLHLSMEQATLLQLVRTADAVVGALADEIPASVTAPISGNVRSNPVAEDTAVTTTNCRFTFPYLTLTGRTGGLLVSLTVGHQPISTIALWGWLLSVKMHTHTLDCAVKMSDLVLYDHPSYREENEWTASGSGADFARMLSFGDGNEPMVVASVVVTLQSAGSSTPSSAVARIRTEAMQTVVSHTHLHKIVQWFKQRELLEQIMATSAKFNELMAAVPIHPPSVEPTVLKDMYAECVAAMMHWQIRAEMRAKSPIIYIPLSDSACLPRFRDPSDSSSARTGKLPKTTAWPCIACALGSATAKMICNRNGTSILGNDGEHYPGNILRYSSDITDARVWVYSAVESSPFGGKSTAKFAPTDCHAIPLVDDWNTYLRSSLVLPASTNGTTIRNIQSDTHLVVTPILLRLSNEACYTLGQVLLAQRWPDVGDFEPLAPSSAAVGALNGQQPAHSNNENWLDGLPEIHCTTNVRLQGVGVLFYEKSNFAKAGVMGGTVALKPSQSSADQNGQADGFAAIPDSAAHEPPATCTDTNLLAITVSGIKLDVDAQLQSILHNIGMASAAHQDLGRSAAVVISLAHVDLVDYRAANLPFHHLFAKHVSLDSDLSTSAHTTPTAATTTAAVPFVSSSELAGMAMTDPVIRVRAAFGQTGLQCQVHISNMHALVSAETLRCLYFVIRGCVESAMAAIRHHHRDDLHRPQASPMQTHKKFLPVDKNGGYKANGGVVASAREQHREVIHPRPSSSPMAPSYSFLPSQSNPTAAKPEAEHERQLMFSPAACTLPSWLRSIQITLTLSSCGLWIPSDDHDPDAPAVLSLGSVQADLMLGQSDGNNDSHLGARGNAALQAHVIVADLRLGLVKPRLPGFLLDAGKQPFYEPQPRTDDETVASSVHSLNGSSVPWNQVAPDVQFETHTMLSVDDQSVASMSLVALDYGQYFEVPASNRASQLGPYSAILCPTTIKVAANVHLHPDLLERCAQIGVEERKSQDPHIEVIRPILCTVHVDIRAVEAMVYVDYRPFQWIVERTLVPLAEIFNPPSVSPSPTSASSSTNMAAVMRAPPQSERLAVAETVASPTQVASWADVLENLADLMQVDCAVELERFKLYLVNNVYQQPSAVLQVALNDASLNVVLPSADGRLILTSAVQAEIEYYNVSVMTWEPLIEPFHAQAEVKAPVDSNLSCVVHTDGGEALELRCERSDLRAVLEVVLAITDIINVNVTLSFIEMLTNTVRLFSELGSTSQDGVKQEHDLSITWLRNDTGVHLQYWTTDPNHTHDVRAHSQSPLLSETQIGSPDHIINTAHGSRLVSLSLQRPGSTPWRPLRDVPCEVNGARIFWLESSNRDGENAAIPSLSDARMSRKLELESLLDNASAVPVICEATNQHGLKTLVLRSTMRLQNTTKVPFRVRLLTASTSRPLRQEGSHRSGWDVLWETVLPVNSVLPVPIHLCAATNAYFELSPLYRAGDPVACEMSTAIIPVPSFTPQDRKIMKGQGRGASSSLKRRKDKVIDLKAAFSQPVDRLQGRGEEYAHWLSFMPLVNHGRVAEGAELTHLTVAASVRGASRGRQSASQVDPCGSWLRTIALCSPLAVSNLLAERVEFRLCVHSEDEAELDWSCREWIESGDEWQWFGCHPSEAIDISVRLPNMDWSNPVMLSGCADYDQEPSVLVAELPSLNGSVLPIQLEVSDVLGLRKVHLYAPYWIVSLSTLPLQFQHDPSSITNKDLNGKDGVAAHQHYETFLMEKAAGGVESGASQLEQLWRSRGQDGVILGPAEPIRGFPDLVPKPSHGSMTGATSDGISRTVLLAADRENGRGVHPPLRSRRSSLLSQVSDVSAADSLGLTTQYNVAMVGSSHSDSESTKLRFRIEGAPWSSSVNLSSSAGTHKHLQLVGKSIEERSEEDEPLRVTNASVFPCGISFHAAPAPFHRTKLITVVDQFMVVNNVGRVIELRHGGQQRQLDQIHVMVLNASEAKPIFWSSSGSTHQKQFQVRLQEYGWEWSGRFKIDDHEQTEIPLRLRNEHNSTVFLMTIDVIRFESRVVISLRARPFETAPYRIENHTLDTVRLHQAGVENVGLTLLPYHSCGYAWDEPLGKHELVVDKIAPGATRGARTWVQDGTFSFDQLRAYETDNHIMVRVTAEGPTRVMQLVDRRSGWDEVLRPMLEEAEDEDLIDGDASAIGPAPLQVTVAVSGIGVSLIDGQPQELLYASIADLILEYIHNAADEVYSRCMVRRIQVDSQIWSTPFPTLFYPLEEAFEYNRQRAASGGNRVHSMGASQLHHDLQSIRNIAWKPFLTVEAIRGFRYPGVHFLRLLSFDVQPFDVSVEGTIIMAMTRMAMQVMDVVQGSSAGQAGTSLLGSTEPGGLRELGAAFDDVRSPTSHALSLDDGLLDNNNNDDEEAYDDDDGMPDEIRPIPFVADLMKRYDPKTIQEVLAIRGRRLYLERLVLSDIRLNVSFNPSVREVDPELLALAESSAVVKFILGPGAALASILNCALHFRGLELKHLFVDEQALGVRLATHYTTQALGQAYLLLGSSEALGNPARLMSLLGQGMWDFIREPVVGLFTSPQAFGVGVVRGTSSLLTRTVASLSDSASHMSSWLASTIVAFGIADTHRINAATSTAVVIRPRGAVSGLSQGIVGLFSEPIYGLRTAGARGAVKGLVLGALGVFAKPTFGLLDTASKMFSMLSFRVLPQIALDQKSKMRRVRPPRYFRSPFLPLQVFKPEENAGEEYLSRVQNGQYRSEGYVWHAQLANVIVILTPKRLLVVGDQQDYCVVHWQTKFERIVLLETNSQQHDVSSPLAIGSFVVERPAALVSDFQVQLYHLPDSTVHSSEQTPSIDRPRLSPRRGNAKAGLDALGMRLVRRVLRFENSEQQGTFISYILKYEASLRTEELTRTLAELALVSHTPRSLRSTSSFSALDVQDPWPHALLADRPHADSIEASEEDDSMSLPS